MVQKNIIQLYKFYKTFACYFFPGVQASLKRWNAPCPLCYAMNCATYLGGYLRKKIYFRDQVYSNVTIIRFECHRRQPNVSVGTHRTFSLLPCPLIPYQSHTISVCLTIAETLAKQKGRASQTANLITNRFFEATPEPAVVLRIGQMVYAAIAKLHQIAQTVAGTGWRTNAEPGRERLAEFIRFVQRYRSQELQEQGICALCYDYFYLFQRQQPYMQRDFLFGTPSQKCI